MKKRSGTALVLAMLAIALMVTMAAAYAGATSLNLHQSDNFRDVVAARMAAESGLSFFTSEMRNCGVSGSLRGQALLSSLATKLGARLNGTPNLGGVDVVFDGTTIFIPRINLGSGTSFAARITLPASDTLRLSVTGLYAGGTVNSGTSLQRVLELDFHPTWEEAIGYGVLSVGPVQLGMNTTLAGITDPADGSVFSEAPGLAVEVGSGSISGSIMTSDPSATVSIYKTTVGGAIVHNAKVIKLPAIDRASYKSMATTVVDSTTNVSGGTFKNIIIKANTNPVFGDVTIQGVMYVESPNNIQFTNNVNFTGVMAADDPAPGSPVLDNYIYFNNNMTFKGVEDLPDTLEFQKVKECEGASILCPGFTMEFKNNMTSVAGIMALKSLIAKNNANSTIDGSLLIYGTTGLDFRNNMYLSISVSGSTPPPGFVGNGLLPLEADPDTYTEK